MKSLRIQCALPLLAGLLGALALGPALKAQTHKVAKPENIARTRYRHALIRPPNETYQVGNWLFTETVNGQCFQQTIL